MGVAAGAHVVWAAQRYGLQRAWQKSLARKGSFTNRLDPRRVLHGLLHFYAIWGEAAAAEAAGLSDDQRREHKANWHAWYWKRTGSCSSRSAHLHVA